MSPTPPPASGSPSVKYLNSADLYTETAGGRRDSKTSNSSSTKNDYYYDKENELYSQRRVTTKPKLAAPREEREVINSSYQRHHQLTSSLSPIPSPTLNVTKFCLIASKNNSKEYASNYVFYLLFSTISNLSPSLSLILICRRALANCIHTVR